MIPSWNVKQKIGAAYLLYVYGLTNLALALAIRTLLNWLPQIRYDSHKHGGRHILQFLKYCIIEGLKGDNPFPYYLHLFVRPCHSCSSVWIAHSCSAISYIMFD